MYAAASWTMNPDTKPSLKLVFVRHLFVIFPTSNYMVH